VARERAYPTDEKYRDSDCYTSFVERHNFAKKIVPGFRVLDTCCGTAYGTFHFINPNSSWTCGVDYSLKSLQYYKYHKKALPLVQMNALHLAIPSKSFDIVLSLESIEHFSEQDGKTYVEEMYRVLKPGGVLMGSTPLCADDCLLPVLQAQNEFHPYLYTQHALDTLLKQYFVKLDIYEIYNETSPYFIFFAKKAGELQIDLKNIRDDLSKSQPNIKNLKAYNYIQWSKGLSRIGDRKNSLKFAFKAVLIKPIYFTNMINVAVGFLAPKHRNMLRALKQRIRIN